MPGHDAARAPDWRRQETYVGGSRRDTPVDRIAVHAPRGSPRDVEVGSRRRTPGHRVPARGPVRQDSGAGQAAVPRGRRRPHARGRRTSRSRAAAAAAARGARAGRLDGRPRARSPPSSPRARRWTSCPASSRRRRRTPRASRSSSCATTASRAGRPSATTRRAAATRPCAPWTSSTEDDPFVAAVLKGQRSMLAEPPDESSPLRRALSAAPRPRGRSSSRWSSATAWPASSAPTSCPARRAA